MNRPAPGSTDRERPNWRTDSGRTDRAQKRLRENAKEVDAAFANAIEAAGEKCPRCRNGLGVLAVLPNGSAIVGCRKCRP